MFFKVGVLKNITTFTGKRLWWPLQAFFYRTPTVAASRFLLQQISFFQLEVYESPHFALFTVSGFTEKVLKAFLSCLCQYLLFSINR